MRDQMLLMIRIHHDDNVWQRKFVCISSWLDSLWLNSTLGENIHNMTTTMMATKKRKKRRIHWRIRASSSERRERWQRHDYYTRRSTHKYCFGKTHLLRVIAWERQWWLMHRVVNLSDILSHILSHQEWEDDDDSPEIRDGSERWCLQMRLHHLSRLTSFLFNLVCSLLVQGIYTSCYSSYIRKYRQVVCSYLLVVPWSSLTSWDDDERTNKMA